MIVGGDKKSVVFNDLYADEPVRVYGSGIRVREENADEREQGEEGVKPHRRRYSLYVSYAEHDVDPIAPCATGEPCGRQGCEPTRTGASTRPARASMRATTPRSGFAATTCPPETATSVTPAPTS